MEKGDFDGVGYPVLNCPPVVVLSRGRFLYGTVTYVTERQNMLVVLTSWRRTWGTVIKRHKQVSYLKNWERVSPPRKMLAVEGKIVNIAPPE